MKLKDRREIKRKQAEAFALKENKRREKYMRMAIKRAEKAEEKGEVPIGAVIVYGGRVIASSYNMRESKKVATAHAEILAIEKACGKIGDWRLNGAEMFVTLEPCAMCAGAIANARISAVYFGAKEPKGGACGSVHKVLPHSGLNSKTEVAGGVLGEECSALIKNFFENKRNKIGQGV